MTHEEIIKTLKGMLIVNVKEREAVKEACKILDDNRWRFVYADDPATLPPVDKNGESDFVMLSFSNCSAILNGRYMVDMDGAGAFYGGDEIAETLAEKGLFVNAWMPLPSPYKGEEDGQQN